jgi:ribosomal protein L2
MLSCCFFYSTEVGDQPDSPQISTPKIRRHPAPVTTYVHNKIELECSAEGAAVYDWYKDGKLLRSTGAQGKLVIEKATPTDAGKYQCIAISSKGGKTTSNDAKVTVGMCSNGKVVKDSKSEWGKF